MALSGSSTGGNATAKEYFAQRNSYTVATWRISGPLLFWPQNGIGTAVGNVGTWNTFVTASAAVLTNGGSFTNVPDVTAYPQAVAIAMIAGDYLSTVSVVAFDALPNVTTSGTGVFLTETIPSVMNTDELTKAVTNVKRICVVACSDGFWHIWTCSGAALTDTATTVAAVAATKYKIQIAFTAGSSVTVTINDAAQTPVTLNLPDRVSYHGYGKGATAGAGRAYNYNGAFDMVPA